ncbi:MAG: heme o synthase [Parachlamydiales bacterium]|jgi:protoheme IX farnesyltransferase
MLKTYYMLTKPGIILGNIVTTAGGFALASKGHLDYLLFMYTLIGLGLVIASAGVFNNYIDRAMDAKMARTKNRPLATGAIPNLNALIFGAILGIIGIFVLGYYTNVLTVLVTLTGFIVYLVLYAILKYRSFYGTIVGSIAGAVPPVVGYAAASNTLDLGALILFTIMLLWQMPHFFAISIYRLKDYSAAQIPVLPLVKGMYATKVQMLIYIIAFIVSAVSLSLAGYTGYVYGIFASLLGLSWMGLCITGFDNKDNQNTRWAYNMFVYSLVVIMGLFITMPFDTYS